VTGGGEANAPKDKRRKRKRFKLRLVIRHPSIDPDAISKELELKPFRCWQVGKPRGNAEKAAPRGDVAGHAMDIRHQISNRLRFRESNRKVHG
jgi:hypothetical protein